MECLICLKEFEAKRKSRKTCSSKCRNKLFYNNHTKEINTYRKEHRAELRKVATLSHYNWTVNNSEHVRNYRRDYYNNRLENDLLFKLKCSLRTRLGNAIKNNQKTGSAVSDLGCSIEELKKHLESKFKPGMSWNNWSKDGWHIDHIKPLNSFDLTDPIQLKEACKYTNLQPLWAFENLSKGDKLDNNNTF